MNFFFASFTLLFWSLHSVSNHLFFGNVFAVVSLLGPIKVTTNSGDEVKRPRNGYLRQGQAFQPDIDDRKVYEEQLRFYMVANNITDATKKRSILLTPLRGMACQKQYVRVSIARSVHRVQKGSVSFAWR